MKCGIVGVGNIGGIIAKRLVETGTLDKSELFLASRTFERLKPFAEQGFQISSVKEIAEKCEVIFLCVKPQDSDKMFEELGEAPDRLIISTMTGVTIKRIVERTKSVKVVRIMPNIPSMIGQGVIGLAKSESLNQQDWQTVEKLLSCLGKIFEVKEELIPAVTALSGSGPAFIFVIVDALIDAGIRMGLSYDLSRRMVLETMKGSAELLLQLGNHPGEFRHVVTSPAGTTIEGIYRMERERVRGALMKTIQDTYMRALELQKE
ncbi:pyrroline-5-carboxylate reductase [Pseudothermotoga thermarum]|uniref:Pyrroline-5-carboxylate reductase n=1 Tax=Pseudothermotoga thermarum DSM 5069 TaxID=688269 RepID=F7YUU6_9THEM|nr:pyrroline-5-carboxylate reductase [Pseudothermotoga thermarum]AEH51506.1 pyrroline-5-carboxylate reductase [Pseudothermotoga thermarum DSM 5069]